jgi:hypothetical protein
MKYKRKHKLAYLACPYTHSDPAVVEQRYQAGIKAASWLMSAPRNFDGTELLANVFSPITHSHPLHKIGGLRGDWAFWKEIDTDYLSVCDMIIVLNIPGWSMSTGVMAELGIARDFKLPCYFLTPCEDGKYTLTSVTL